MNRLDRYVGRIMLGAFGATLLFFLFLSILVDLLNNVGKYADRAAQEQLGGFDMAVRLLWYYGKLLPVLVTSVTPIATVIAGMFTVARLQHANEVVPMLFVGRSIHRVLRPILLVGCGAAGGMAACWQWVVPNVGAALASEEAFLRDGTVTIRSLVHEREVAGTAEYFYVKEFQPRERTMTDVRLLAQGVLAGEVRLVAAPAASWDDERQDWRLQAGVLSHARGGEPAQWLGRPDLTPAVLVRQSRDTIDPELLSYSDLVEMAAARPNRPDIRLALHRHVTYPLANLLFLLLTLPLAVFYERGGRFERVLAAIVLCGGYMLCDLTCQSLGNRVGADGAPMLHPVVAAWLPTIVFGSLGVVLTGGAKT
jgi:lipopolysaccharide export system permease protein